MASDETIITLPLHFDGRTLYIDRASSSQDGYVSYEDFAMFLGGGAMGVTRIETGVGLTGGPITTTGTIALTNTGVISGIYHSPTLSVDDQGRIDAIVSGNSGNFLPLEGGTMSGPLTLYGDPAAPLEAATRQYVLANGRLPFDYLVSDFKASGSAAQFTGTIVAGSLDTVTLPSSPTHDFQVGQGICVKGALAGSGQATWLITTVTAITATTITLQNPASQAVSAVANNVQHDDSAAINTAMAYVVNHGGGDLYFAGRYYRCNGPFTSAHSILAPPYLGATSDKAVYLGLIGLPRAHIVSTATGVPASGVVIQSDRVGSTADHSVFATAVFDSSYSIDSPSNVTIKMKSLCFVTYPSPQISCVDLGMANSCIEDLIITSQDVYYTGFTQPPANGRFALRLARVNAAMHIQSRNIFVYGYDRGWIVSELWLAEYCGVAYCNTGFTYDYGNFPLYGDIFIYHCPTPIEIREKSTVDLLMVLEQAAPGTDWSSPTPGRDIYDPSDKLQGQLRFSVATTGTGGTMQLSVTGCTKLTLISLRDGMTVQGNYPMRFKGDVEVDGVLNVSPNGVPKPLVSGPTDSGTTGFRELRVAN